MKKKVIMKKMKPHHIDRVELIRHERFVKEQKHEKKKRRKT